MNLEKLRKERKLTQEEASRLLNMQKQTYQNYELKKRQPDIDTLIKLADFYHVTIDELVGRDINTINLNALPPVRSKLIKYIMKMNDLQEMRAEAYLDGLMNN